MEKICNQTFVKDQFRDRKYIGTMKCITCGEESNINLKLGCSLIEFNTHLKAFEKLHSVKGCNKSIIKDTPEWACTTINLSLANHG